MLSKQQVDRHNKFLHTLSLAPNVEALRRLIRKATHYQLRVLLLLLASVARRYLPATEAVRKTFYNSRKKRLLHQVVRSKAQLKRFLTGSGREEWRRVLLDLAPLVRACLSLLFHSSGPQQQEQQQQQQ